MEKYDITYACFCIIIYIFNITKIFIITSSFFQLMGKVFGFVASDVKSKIEILEELRQGENGEHYSTLKEMIKYESENGLLSKSDYTSGSRTLLRLHRGLGTNLKIIWTLKSSNCKLWVTADQVWYNMYNIYT